VDRPQKYYKGVPGAVRIYPADLCGDQVAAVASERTGVALAGDGDPIDVCVLTDRRIEHGNLILECIPIGGFRMLDGNEVDEKIIAVLKDDTTYGTYSDITEVSESTLERLRHYFLTYKQSSRLQDDSVSDHASLWTAGREINHRPKFRGLSAKVR
jgi:inorganic pyrophosphatase